MERGRCSCEAGPIPVPFLSPSYLYWRYWTSVTGLSQRTRFRVGTDEPFDRK